MFRNLSFLGLLGMMFLVSCVSGPPGVPQAPLLATARYTGVTGPHAPKVTDKGVLFQLEAPEAVLVTIAGQFNGWNPDATALTKGADGVWSITLDLKKGIKQRYKYLVDGIWIPDPENPATEPDGFGSINSVINLAEVKK